MTGYVKVYTRQSSEYETIEIKFQSISDIKAPLCWYLLEIAMCGPFSGERERGRGRRGKKKRKREDGGRGRVEKQGPFLVVCSGVYATVANSARRSQINSNGIQSFGEYFNSSRFD